MGLLLAGTFKVAQLTNACAQVTVPVRGIDRLHDCLFHLIPFDPGKGQEGVTAQEALLIVLLILIGLTAWRGLERIHTGFTACTWISIGLVGLTVLTAAIGMQPHAGGLDALKEAAYTVFPVNPKYATVDAEHCYASLSELPEKLVVTALPPAVTEAMAESCAALGIAKVWMPSQTWSEKAVELCSANGIREVHDVCVVFALRALHEKT